ncbi:MAG: cation diffusion facilitator family transporter [Mycobacterium sp.]|jgi:cation diffusion facilitator family transporter|nr:cation diffusion facilitator family transporter [Mycobacterium sp.]
MSSEGGTKAIVAALAANVGIAIAKLVGFVVTGSTSMLAEAVHSLADSGNQLLLLRGGRAGRREADAEHPFGYGRERYFYAFVVALVLFSLGSLFALYEGVEKVRHPHALTDAPVAIGILLVSIVLEGFSFRTGIREASPHRGSQSWWSYIRRAKAPELPVVLLEDSAALLGLVVALFGVLMALVTGDAVWDGIGSVVIGVLLGAVAITLAIEMKSLLIGEAAAPASIRAVKEALVDGVTVLRVIHLRTMHLGPDELLIAAKIELAHDLDVAGVAAAIDAAEVRVRAAEPLARVMYLEPDLYRAALAG